MLTINFKSNNNLISNKIWDALAGFYWASVHHNLPAALWRYPNCDAPQAVVDLSGTVHPVKIDFTRKESGFAFAPFVNNGGNETLFIKADLFLSETGLHSYTNRTGSNGHTTGPEIGFLDTFQNLADNPHRSQDNWFTPPASRQTDTISTKAAFCDLVQEAISYIQSTGIKKIVTSRATETSLPPNLDPVTIFELLCRRYPHAFVSLVSIPDLGTWLGASPELLLSLNPGLLTGHALVSRHLGFQRIRRASAGERLYP